jgi:hypothetical protein
MDFYIQPEDELILNLLLEQDDYKDFFSFLKEQSIFEEVSERGIALDHALDPNVVKVVDVLRHSHINVKVTQIAMEMGKAAVDAAVGALVAGWIKNRNDKKKERIEAKEAEPLLFDQYGHRINVLPESKKRKR